MTRVAPPGVLVVEDEPLIGLDLQQLLQDAGFKVIGPATTIEQALDCIHERELRAAVVDVNLHGKTTDGVVRELLQASVPVLVLTGYSRKCDAPPFSACRIMQKPYDPAQVLQVLQQLVTTPAHSPRRKTSEIQSHRR